MMCLSLSSVQFSSVATWLSRWHSEELGRAQKNHQVVLGRTSSSYKRWCLEEESCARKSQRLRTEPKLRNNRSRHVSVHASCIASTTLEFDALPTVFAGMTGELNDHMLVDVAKRITDKTQLCELATKLGVQHHVVDSTLNNERKITDATLTVLKSWKEGQLDRNKAFRTLCESLLQMDMGSLVVEALHVPASEIRIPEHQSRRRRGKRHGGPKPSRSSHRFTSSSQGARSSGSEEPSTPPPFQFMAPDSEGTLPNTRSRVQKRPISEEIPTSENKKKSKLFKGAKHL